MGRTDKLEWAERRGKGRWAREERIREGAVGLSLLLSEKGGGWSVGGIDKGSWGGEGGEEEGGKGRGREGKEGSIV